MVKLAIGFMMGVVAILIAPFVLAFGIWMWTLIPARVVVIVSPQTVSVEKTTARPPSCRCSPTSSDGDIPHVRIPIGEP